MYKEIESIRKLSKCGDKKAKETLLMALKPLILSSIRRYYNDYSQYEDLVQEGYETILKCVIDFDESKGVNFLGYAKVELKYLYLNKHKEKKNISLNETVGEEGKELIDFIECEELNPEETLILKEEKEILLKKLYSLTKRQREVLVYFYIEKMPMLEIAEKLNISYRTVVNTKVRALEKMTQ